jgi:hypothetical protein
MYTLVGSISPTDRFVIRASAASCLAITSFWRMVNSQTTSGLSCEARRSSSTKFSLLMLFESCLKSEAMVQPNLSVIIFNLIGLKLNTMVLQLLQSIIPPFFIAALLLLNFAALKVNSLSVAEAKHLISQSDSFDTKTSSSGDVNPDDLNFYGKIVSVCEFEDCFSAVVASGRTNFYGDGGDLANIYVPANDYDTWRQSIPNNTGSPVQGDFIYQMQNESLSCLTIELKWSFSPAVVVMGHSLLQQVSSKELSPAEPFYSCEAVAIASNWDCHIDWLISAECYFNSTLNQISALYTVTNLGPEQQVDNSKVISARKLGNLNEEVKVVGSRNNMH